MTAEPIDLAVVGAGPCGLSAAVAARQAGLGCVVFDKGAITRSIALYPTYGSFFSTADRLEIGGVPFIVAGYRPTRLEALKYYRRIAQEFELDVRQYTEVTSLTGSHGDFTVETRHMSGSTDTLRARNVVVATGYADSPNLLGVPGEDLPKVSHYYTEGHPYYDQDCVVVGAGNSAVEAALDLFRSGARVTLVHFLDRLDPGVKPWILPDIENRLKNGEIAARWNTRVAEILPDRVRLRHEGSGQVDELENDFVIAMTGYCPSTNMLEGLGVRIDPETGVPEHDPDTMETNAPGVYIAGVLAGGNRPDRIFIETGRHHGPAAVRHIQSGLPARRAAG
ncbi:MAG TPA: YpdA family putative bacillithiol disulfide reductase [Longimicrobiales bacterium]|nr:YpdA family putative bacillithiol disulfide reductase [Longimicrobiales bacterium]